jgi:hypothetical protein
MAGFPLIPSVSGDILSFFINDTQPAGFAGVYAPK